MDVVREAVLVAVGVRVHEGLLVDPAAQAPHVHGWQVAFDAAPTAADQVPVGHSVALMEEKGE